LTRDGRGSRKGNSSSPKPPISTSAPASAEGHQAPVAFSRSASSAVHGCGMLDASTRALRRAGRRGALSKAFSSFHRGDLYSFWSRSSISDRSFVSSNVTGFKLLVRLRQGSLVVHRTVLGCMTFMSWGGRDRWCRPQVSNHPVPKY